MVKTDKSIYSLVLSDSVVEAVDIMARGAGLSRSAMINQLLAERVAYITPEYTCGAAKLHERGILPDGAIVGQHAFLPLYAQIPI